MPRQLSDPITSGREFSPFWEAFNTAKRITTRKPREEQPQEADSLEAVVGMLTDQERNAVVFRAQIPVVSEEFPIEGFFALARAARMSHAAHAAAAVLNAKRIEGLTVPDLQSYGLVELKVSTAGKPYFLPKFGKERVKEAAKQLAVEGRHEGAKALRLYLERSAQAAELGKARRREAGQTAPKVTPEPTEAKTKAPKKEAENKAVDETA